MEIFTEPVSGLKFFFFGLQRLFEFFSLQFPFENKRKQLSGFHLFFFFFDISLIFKARETHWERGKKRMINNIWNLLSTTCKCCVANCFSGKAVYSGGESTALFSFPNYEDIRKR